MSEAIGRGITRYMLYSMRDKGEIEQVSRGVYRLLDLPPISNPDLVTVGIRFPKSVICLISALSFHELTTQIPHRVYLAILRGSRPPVLDYPPVFAHYFTEAAYHEGIEEYSIDGVKIKIYSREKTLADCFKFRNKIGMDVVLEALKLYRDSKTIKIDKLMEYARVCRVEKTMRPYLESSL